MRQAISVGVTVDAPDETVEYAQHLFDQLLDFFTATIVKWNEENENGLKFNLTLST